jgi:hypothetical protein
MNIVLNETIWAHDMIAAKSLGRKPFETVSRVARYYLDNKFSKTAVRKLLDNFLLQCDPTISLPKWSDMIDSALEYALRHKAINIEYIPISSTELKVIDELNGRQSRRLAFTLLCLAKYWDIANDSDAHWVNSKDSEIMRMANINTSIKRQSILYRMLNERGLIQFSKRVDNTNVRVCFVDDTNIALKITDLRNLGYQFLRYKGEPYFECKNCGITTKYNNNGGGLKQKYCKECAVEVAMRQSINSVMRIRERQSNPSSKVS